MTGFIPGSRGSFMLDAVVVAMIAVVPILLFAIQKAKSGQYQNHKLIMIVLASVLLAAVIAFELEMRLLGWKQLAEPSPYYNTSLFYVLGVHLFFSVSTTLALAVTVIAALKRFSDPPRPNDHSNFHRRIGKLSAVGLIGTSVTGWIFYWMAFVA